VHVIALTPSSEPRVSSVPPFSSVLVAPSSLELTMKDSTNVGPAGRTPRDAVDDP